MFSCKATTLSIIYSTKKEIEALEGYIGSRRKKLERADNEVDKCTHEVWLERYEDELRRRQSVLDFIRDFPIGTKVEFLGMEHIVRWVGLRDTEYGGREVDEYGLLTVDLFRFGNFAHHAWEDYGAGEGTTQVVDSAVRHIKFIKE